MFNTRLRTNPRYSRQPCGVLRNNLDCFVEFCEGIGPFFTKTKVGSWAWNWTCDSLVIYLKKIDRYYWILGPRQLLLENCSSTVAPRQLLLWQMLLWQLLLWQLLPDNFPSDNCSYDNCSLVNCSWTIAPLAIIASLLQNSIFVSIYMRPSRRKQG